MSTEGVYSRDMGRGNSRGGYLQQVGAGGAERLRDGVAEPEQLWACEARVSIYRW